MSSDQNNKAMEDLTNSANQMSLNPALNPNASVFVPRFGPGPTGGGGGGGAAASGGYSGGDGSINGNWRSGNRSTGQGYNNESNAAAAAQNKNFARPPSETEDFPAITCLKRFLDIINQYPDQFESRVKDLTKALKSSIVEDAEVVMETLVSSIVDQAITDIYFRTNGVRLIVHLSDHLDLKTKKGSFHEMIIQRCLRETTRRDLMTSTTDRGTYLRGLTHLISELYAQRHGDSLAQCLPQLLETLLKNPEKENVKTTCQVLKLCGSDLERYCTQNGIETFDEILKSLDEVKSLPDAKLSKYMKEMAVDVVAMRKNGWKPLPSRSAGIVNPYLNYDPFGGSNGAAAAASAPPQHPQAMAHQQQQQQNHNPYMMAYGGGPAPYQQHQQHQQHQQFDPQDYYDEDDDDEGVYQAYEGANHPDLDDPNVASAFEDFLKASGQM